MVSPELARDLARISFDCGRQIGVLISRDGAVREIVVGTAAALELPDLPDSRGGRAHLRGLRLVHTHLGGEPLTQDDLLDLVFLRLDCVAAVQVDANGGATRLLVAHILPAVPGEERPGWEILPPMQASEPSLDFLDLVQSLEEELERTRARAENVGKAERAVLVSVTTESRVKAQASMDELVELARAGGIEPAATVIQRLRKANPKYLIGKGKLGEIVVRALQLGVDLIIFDQNLNPSQVRAITDTTELRVIDRTQLILDIFARRAQSREGKIQVEVAQLKYLVPRLGVRDDALSRLAGGIGTRGPGETRLEIDRRRIRERITRLEKQLREVRKDRGQRRAMRVRKSLPVISIVGYTNAGKSTLLNTLTRSRVFVEDRLFATLDPTSRRLRFPRDMEVIVTDTVGFIRDLPKDLVEAFRATLEELDDADLLLHVVDIGNPRVGDQVEAVRRILSDLGLDGKPVLMVLNKMDLVRPEAVAWLVHELDGVPVSALDPETLPPLIAAMQERVEAIWAEGEEPEEAAGGGPPEEVH